jgi:hypothetical protein
MSDPDGSLCPPRLPYYFFNQSHGSRTSGYDGDFALAGECPFPGGTRLAARV